VADQLIAAKPQGQTTEYTDNTEGILK
jgi:hypothetical protein